MYLMCFILLFRIISMLINLFVVTQNFALHFQFLFVETGRALDFIVLLF